MKATNNFLRLTFILFTIAFAWPAYAASSTSPCRIETDICRSAPILLSATVTPDMLLPIDTVNAMMQRRAEAIKNGDTGIARDPNRDWWHLAKTRQLNLNDTTVSYPRFLAFCVKVYQLADKVFNSYNPEYVVGTGYRWKLRGQLEIWADSYSLNLRKKLPITMMSEPYASTALYLQYMAVSVNTSLDLNHLINHAPSNHTKWEFSFNCALFNLDLVLNSNTGGSFLRTFGDYRKGHFFKEYFPGVKMSSLTSDLYYYTNNKKYANGAAYNYSKIQKKSAGSAIVGVGYAYEDVGLDLTKVPAHLVPYLTVAPHHYRFHYNNFCLLVGYGHNWVLNRHLLLNLTALPSVGVNYCFADSFGGAGRMFSANFKARTSFTYNLKRLFVNIQGRADMHWYHSGELNFFTLIPNANLSVGVRF